MFHNKVIFGFFVVTLELYLVTLPHNALPFLPTVAQEDQEDRNEDTEKKAIISTCVTLSILRSLIPKEN